MTQQTTDNQQPQQPQLQQQHQQQAVQSYYPNVPQPVAQPIVQHNNNDSNNNNSIDTTTAQPILSLMNTQLYTLKNNNKSLKCIGTLELLAVDTADNQTRLVLSMITHEYTFVLALNDSLPIVQMSQYVYVLPAVSINGSNIKTYGITLDTTHPHNTDETLKLFDALLRENSEYAISNAEQILEENNVPVHVPHVDEQQQQQIQQPIAVQPSLQQQPESTDHVINTSKLVSSGIDKGAAYAVKGIALGALLLSSGIKKGSAWYKQHYMNNNASANIPQQPSQQSSVVHNRLQTAAKVSGAAVQVSSALMSVAVAASNTLSHYLTNYLNDTDVVKRIQQADTPREQAIKGVVNSGVSGLINIWESLELAGLSLLTDSSSAIVDTLNSTHGEHYGALAASAGVAVKNTAQAAIALRKCTVNSIAKSAIKATTQQVLHHPSSQQQQIANSAAIVHQQQVGGVVQVGNQ